MSRFLLLLIPVWLLNNCAVKPTPRVDRTPPPPQALDFASKRITALMVTKQEDIREWISQGFPHPAWGHRAPACGVVPSAAVRQLLPEAVSEVDPVAAYAGDERPAPPDRPWLLVNMVASADGATAVDGRSGALGGAADRAAFTAIRAVADVILVAAGTARAEGYGPPRTPPELQAARQARGQAAKPRIALVTRSVDLDFDAELFADPASRCLVIAPDDAPADRLSAAAQVADVVTAGRGGVDLPAAVAHLRSLGATVVLAEGGPSLLGQLAAADLVDELCLTLSPTLVAGDSARIVHGANLPDGIAPLHVERVLEQDGFLLLRYLVAHTR